MSRLQRFTETTSLGVETGRIAFAIDPEKLSAVSPHHWTLDIEFNAAEAILIDPSLKVIFQAALKNGFTIVAPLKPAK